MDASGGSARASSAEVSSEKRGTVSPRASAASAHCTARPPAFVMMPTRFPVGAGWCARIAATSSISSSVSVRITPFCRNSASRAVSDATIAAVCEAAARIPAGLRPLLTATIGFREPIRRARRANRFGFPKDSR